jgi:pyruvate dehydrogenase E2 component (dihydrolipoamide acetyltransferase)
MSKPILMPQVGQDLTEGKLIEWRVKVGDKVAKGDIVAVVESEKASFDVEAFEAGTVLNLLYDEGATTKVLAPLLFVGDPTEDAATPHSIEQAKAASEDGAVIAPIGVGMSERAADAQLGRKANGAPRSSPFARRLAKSNGLEIAAIVGTGPHGAVVARDVKSVIQAADPAPRTAAPRGPRSAAWSPRPLPRSLRPCALIPRRRTARGFARARVRRWS